jgi:hypothetical protein
MKRRSWIPVLAGLVALLVGCGSPEASTGPNQQALEATQAITAREPKPTDTSSPPPLQPTSTEPLPTQTEEPIATATAAYPSPTAPPAATPLPAETTAAELGSSDVQRIAAAEAWALLEQGSAVLYDARSAAQYQTLHAAGALSLPDTEIAQRVGELPPDKSLIFY